MFWKRRTYLDRAAGVSANPSSPHEEGRRAKAVLEDARTTVARLVEVQSDDVIFTSGATESNALAILGYVRAFRATGKKSARVFYLPTAHASIVENARLLAAEGVVVAELPIKEYRVDTDTLSKMLGNEDALVTMEAVCGETGVVWNTREVAETLRKFSTGAAKNVSAPGRSAKSYSHFLAAPVLHVDASQAPWSEKISRAHFGADLLTFDAAKVGAIRGIGVLVAHRTIPLVPLYGGGGQERGVRSGSEAPLLAEGFARALAAANAGREAFHASASEAREHLIAWITNAIPNVYIQEGRSQAAHILNLSLPGRDTDYLVALLDEAGFAVSTRSACETDSEEGSRAVLALTGDPERARATLRVSWGPEVSPHDLARFADALTRAVAFIDRSSSG